MSRQNISPEGEAELTRRTPAGRGVPIDRCYLVSSR
jgi:hypothetical protein